MSLYCKPKFFRNKSYNYGIYSGGNFHKKFKMEELRHELRHEKDCSYSEVSGLTYKTFDEWKALGKFVKKGSKATRIGGVPKFSEEQVR